MRIGDADCVVNDSKFVDPALRLYIGAHCMCMVDNTPCIVEWYPLPSCRGKVKGACPKSLEGLGRQKSDDSLC